MTEVSQNLISCYKDNENRISLQSNADQHPISNADQQLLQSYIDQEHEQYVKESQEKIKDENEYLNLHLEHYHYAVNQKFDFKTRNITKKKLVYIFTEALTDLGFKNINSVELQVTLFVILMVFWFRIYMHYLGQLVWLLIM